MKYIYLTLLISIFLIGIASAEQQSLGVFKQNYCVNLIQTCSNCTYNNISSVLYPNSTQALGQVSMTKIGTKYNYTLCSTELAGKYIVNGFGDVDGLTTVWAYDLDVTSTGTNFTISQGLLYIVFVIAGFIIFLLVFYGALKIPFYNTRNEEDKIISINDLKYVKIFLLVISYLIFMSLAGLLKGITLNYIPEIGIDKMFEWIFWIMLSLTWPLIVLSLLFSLILFLTDKKLEKALIRGLPVR